jgi:hypothetical protein
MNSEWMRRLGLVRAWALAVVFVVLAVVYLVRR